MYLYLNTVLTKVFAIIFVFGKFIVFVFKYYAMYSATSLASGADTHALGVSDCDILRLSRLWNITYHDCENDHDYNI